MHFEEEESDFLADGEGERLYFSRNLFRRNTPAEAYRRLTVWLANEARRSGAQRMDLVLAGDVFDLHRTTLWLKDNPDNARPYVASTEVSEILESKVLDILAATTAEAEVSKTLEILRLLANSRYLETPEGSEQEFPATVTVYYIPGNHDRLANVTSNIRKEVRRLLGLDGGDVVVVFGLGPVGCCAVVAAACDGADVVAVEPVESRRNLVESLGAGWTVDPTASDTKAAVLEITQGRGAEASVDRSGNPRGGSTRLS